MANGMTERLGSDVSTTRGTEPVNCGALPGGPSPSLAPGPVGRHRRDNVFEVGEDARFAALVDAAAAAAFHEAACQPPQQAYLALARELTSRGIDPDPTAIFDAAMLISRGHPPALLRQEQRGRHQLQGPA